jgi:alpha-tubulin suppressor-like RCC1 family protein
MKTLKLLLFLLFYTLNSFAQCWTTVTAGYNHTLGIKTDGTLWAWGRNDYGQLGDGTNTNKNVPTQVGSDTDWKFIAAGDNHSMAIKNNGTLWAWGRNNYGQLGDGTIVNKNIPLLVNNDTDWKALSLDTEFTIALKNNGTLWGWGKNSISQLGNPNTLVNIDVPTQIGTDSNWKTIDAGFQTTVALKTDNTFWAWASNANGVFGNGSIVNFNVPTQTLSNTDWQTISMSNSTTLALKTDGSLWAWGENSFGAVGNGTFANNGPNYVPNHIGSATNWVSVSMGRYASRAINSDGALFCWGYNSNGQVGDGTTINRNVPTPVGVGTNWLITFGGLFYSIGLTTNRTLWAWGDNSYGQLGDGTLTTRLSPIQIGSVCTLAVGEYENKNRLKAYPNPSSELLSLEYNLTENAMVKTNITNSLGQIIFSQIANKNSGEQHDPINLSSYPAGVYLITVYTNNLQNTIKIIKN